MSVNVIDKLATCPDMVAPGITSCLGCNVELTMRTVLKILGPNTVVAIPPGCMAGVQTVGWGTKTALKIPSVLPLLDNTASMLSGAKAYFERIGKEVNVVAFAGDGASVDAGFQCLSAAAERGDNLIYVCYDNEGYMNTGFQRSGSTSKGSHTTTTPVGLVSKGKRSQKKDMPMIMAMHDIPYMATASPAYIPDLVKKIEKAKEVKNGLAYIHVLNTCSTGWGYPPELSIEKCRLSVQSRFFPLYEVENGRFRITVPVANPKPVSEYVAGIRKYRHFTREDLREMQAHVDEKWARLQQMAEMEPVAPQK